MASGITGTPGEAKSRIDKPTAWRMSAWGAAATIAMASVTLAAVTESGAQRLQLAVIAVIGPSSPPTIVAQIPPQAIDTVKLAGHKTADDKLAENLRLLTADRDRLNARVAGLERTLEDVTGSLKRQVAERAVEQSIRQAPPLAAPPPMPVISAPAAVAAVTPATNEPSREPTYVPLPKERLANFEASAPPEVAQQQKPDIGIDLGGASSPEALRAHWTVMKANFGPLLGTLRPMMTMRERPGSLSYRLILGPLPNAAAAGQLCARLAAARASCRPTTFINQTAALL